MDNVQNPLSSTDRDAMVRAYQMIPAIRDNINKAKAVGIDMADRETHLNNAEESLKSLLDAYFPGWNK